MSLAAALLLYFVALLYFFGVFLSSTVVISSVIIISTITVCVWGIVFGWRRLSFAFVLLAQSFTMQSN